MRKIFALTLTLMALTFAAPGNAHALPRILQVYEMTPTDLDDVRTLVEYRWYDKAWEAYQEFGNEEDPSLLLKAKILIGLKQYDDALEILQKLEKEGVPAKMRSDVLLREAIVLTKLQRYPEAFQKYRLLLGDRHVGQHRNVLWRFFKTAIEARDYEEGLRVIKGMSGPEVLWWQGWCHYQMGHWKLALQSWNHIHVSSSSVPVRKRRGRARVARTSGNEAQLLYWKASALKKSGHGFEAQDLWQTLIEKYPVSYYGVLALFQLYPQKSDFESSFKALWAQQSSEKYLGVYSKDYQKEIEKEAKRRGLDPNLVFALVWQESRFRDNVVSPTGAIGLVQMMPQTALQIAKGTKLKHFDLLSILDPSVNIQLGCLYLKFLKGLFFDHLPYAIAAYNAGEEAVSRWLTGREKVPVSVFIEEIPYEETQNYTKKVLMAYWVYRWLNLGVVPEELTRF